MKTKTIAVEAARSQRDVEDGQCDVVQDFDTLTEAKAYAKHTLTDDYQRIGEMAEPMRYARVMVDGQNVADYFRR